MQLTAENVSKVFEEANKNEGDLKAKVLGRELFFDSSKLNSDDVYSMLQQLPSEFQEKSGGGMSFLNACMDKDGNHWGEHMHIARLLALGLACGFIEYNLPEEMWCMFTGGMPYFVVKHKCELAVDVTKELKS